MPTMLLQACEAEPTWSRLTASERETVLGALRQYLALSEKYRPIVWQALFAPSSCEPWVDRYRRWCDGRGPYPGAQTAHVVDTFLCQVVSEANHLPLWNDASPRFCRSGFTRDPVALANRLSRDPEGAVTVDHFVFRFDAWVRLTAPMLIRALTREAQEKWCKVRERLHARRILRRAWARLGLSWSRAGQLAKDGHRPAPDFSDAHGRAEARKLPRDIQPQCTVCGKKAHECKCVSADTCGHFGRSPRKDGACPVCRAKKAARTLQPSGVDVEQSGHFRGIPHTRGEGKDTVSFWGKAPGQRGKRPLIPRYVGVEAEVESFQRRSDFWKRIPKLADAVARWHFSIGDDGSLGADGREARLSPARGTAAEGQIREVLGVLKLCGARVTSKCGVHIHVDACDFRTAEQYNALLGAWDIVEPLLFDKMPARDGNQYCQATRYKRVTMDSDGRLLFDRAASSRSPDSDPTRDRYHAVNLCNVRDPGSKRRTIEFRIFEGSVDPEQVITWAHIVSTLTHYAASCDARLSTREGIRSLLRPRATLYLGLES